MKHDMQIQQKHSHDSHQEQSSYQSNTGDAAYNGAAYAFEEVSSSLCSIVKAS